MPDNLPDLVPPTPMPPRRGGRRPGAGAKPGNLNALKHVGVAKLLTPIMSKLVNRGQYWYAGYETRIGTMAQS
jgi:hypothetical protein